MRNIKDYGAVGDGIALDTAPIQKAIDDGGIVYIPEGNYRIGTIYLKSNGGLHLAPGAVLVGSHEREDYNADDFCLQNEVFTEEWVTGAHLIVAVEQENISITGFGTIDGQGRYWMNESNMWGNIDYAPNEERPGQMIYICECRNVRISDVNIVNGPYWHLFLHGCEDVFLRGLNIKGDRPRWTNDGIDIDCCARVTVSDCMIDVGDDGITIRAHKKTLQKKEGICEQVVVTNCIIHSARDYGVRVGVGSGLVRRCILSNLVIEAPNRGGVGIMGRWSSESKYATQIDGVMFSNINIKAKFPFDIFSVAGDAPLPNECYVRNIEFDHVFMTPVETSNLSGNTEVPLENIRFSQVTVDLSDKSDDMTQIFHVRNCHGIEFNNLQTVMGKDDAQIKIVASESCEKVMVR